MIKQFLRRWWKRRYLWQVYAWEEYELGLLKPDAPPPPFKRPRMPRWLQDEVQP